MAMETKVELNPTDIMLCNGILKGRPHELLAAIDSQLEDLCCRTEEAHACLNVVVEEMERLISSKQEALSNTKYRMAIQQSRVAALKGLVKSANDQMEVLTQVNNEMVSVAQTFPGFQKELERTLDAVQKTYDRVMVQGSLKAAATG